MRIEVALGQNEDRVAQNQELDLLLGQVQLEVQVMLLYLYAERLLEGLYVVLCESLGSLEGAYVDWVVQRHYN